jgi:hypothetical protein
MMNAKIETLRLLSPEAPATAPRKTCASANAPRQSSRRLEREWQTIERMIGIYCRDHHQHGDLCTECQSLLDYATVRLDRCQFGAEKPTCAKCPVHCYQKARREQVRVVMRYAGPRMLWEYPLLSLRHWLDGLRSAPQKAG